MSGDRTVVDVSPDMTLPDVCIQCGEPTHRRVRVKAVGPRPPAPARAESKWAAELGCLSCLGSFFFPAFILAAALERRAPPPPVLKVRVPQCAECSRRGRPEFLRADFERGLLRFATTPRFLAWKEQAARRRLDVEAPPHGAEQ